MQIEILRFNNIYMLIGSPSLSQAASNGCEFAMKGEKFEQQGSTELSDTYEQGCA